MTAQGAARSNAYLSLPTRRQATGSIDAIPPAPRTGPIHWWSARLIDGTFAAMGRYSRSPYFAFGGCLFLLFMWVVWVLPIAVMFAWVVVLAGLQVITAMVEGITWLVLWPFTRKREPAKLAKILVMSAVVFVALVIVSVVSSSGNTATLGPAAHGQGQGSGSQPKARPGQHHHRGSAGSAARLTSPARSA